MELTAKRKMPGLLCVAKWLSTSLYQFELSTVKRCLGNQPSISYSADRQVPKVSPKHFPTVPKAEKLLN